MEQNIKASFQNLKEKFYKIQCQNWILSKSMGSGAAGRTLEKLLGVEENQDVLPDFYGIEIKTKIKNGKYPLTLFSCALDNKPLENKRLLFTYGYPDNLNQNFKKFNVTIDAIHRKFFRNFTSFKLKFNYKNEKVRLLIYNRRDELIENVMSWSFKELRSRLEHKLAYMALITVRKARVNNKIYFKYEDMVIYKLKDFKVFLKLIELGKVVVTFKLNQYHDKEKYGDIQDKGTSFDIQKDCIKDLFEEIEV